METINDISSIDEIKNKEYIKNKLEYYSWVINKRGYASEYELCSNKLEEKYSYENFLKEKSLK